MLGGTYDPVHLGHLACAREVADAFALERVLLVLAAHPPHKRAGEAAPAELRWQMLGLATKEACDPTLEACDIELRRSGPSWTVDTLRELHHRNAGADLFLIVGADAYQEIDSWSRPGEILELAHIIVTSRPGQGDPPDAPLPPVAARSNARYDPSIGVYVHTSGHTVRGHRICGIEVSATDIRGRVRAGLPVSHLTGEAVARFIERHRLYGAGQAPASPRDPGRGKHGADHS